MKFLATLMIVVCSVLYSNAQTTDSKGGLKVDKNGVAVKGAKGGGAQIGKNGASAKGAKGKGVEADKKGTGTTPAKK